MSLDLTMWKAVPLCVHPTTASAMYLKAMASKWQEEKNWQKYLVGYK